MTSVIVNDKCNNKTLVAELAVMDSWFDNQLFFKAEWARRYADEDQVQQLLGSKRSTDLTGVGKSGSHMVMTTHCTSTPLRMGDVVVWPPEPHVGAVAPLGAGRDPEACLLFSHQVVGIRGASSYRPCPQYSGPRGNDFTSWKWRACPFIHSRRNRMRLI